MRTRASISCLPRFQFQNLNTFFSNFRFSSTHSNTVNRTNLLNSIRSLSNVNATITFFNEMLTIKPFPSVKDFNFLSFKCHFPNLLTCAVILDGLFKCHFRYEAVSLFRVMEESDLDLDIVIYNVMIDGLCKAGKLNDARKLLASLPAKGLRFDSYTCNIMIGGLCREGFLGDAEDLFMEMEENGCPPNACSYNVFVQGLLRKKYVSRSGKYLKIMEDIGFAVDATTTGLLVGLYSANKESNAFQLQELLQN